MVLSFSKTAFALAVAAVVLVCTQCDRISELPEYNTIEKIVNNTGVPPPPEESGGPITGNPKDPEPLPQVEQKQGVLYAYYPFNGSAEDASGNGHDGLVAGPVPTEDRFGRPKSAYRFDGVDDYIIVENMMDFPCRNAPRSMAGWFRSSKNDPYLMMLFGFGCESDGYNFQVGIGPNYTNEKTEFRVNGWGDSYDWRTGVAAATWLDDKWHHCAVTYDGTITRIYFDGKLAGTTSGYRFITNPKEMHLVIGREIDLDEWEFCGALDDIYIYSRVLTADEVEHMAAPPTSSEPYAFYSFNGNTDDATGNGHDATGNGPVFTTDRFGNEMSACLFDGIDDYVIYRNMSDFPAGNAPRTVCGWFTSTETSPYIMMMFGCGAQVNGHNFQVGIGPGTSESPATQYRVNGWGNSYDWRTGVEVPAYLDGDWHHCAVSYDGTKTSIYFDGELRGATNAFSYLSTPGSMDLVIGREIDLDGWEWKGALDDVGVYACALTADEIGTLAADK